MNKFVIILLIIFGTVTVLGCVESSEYSGDVTDLTTPAVTATPESTETETSSELSAYINESIDYLVTSLENDPDIIDAGVALDGNSVSVAVMIINPEETDRVYLYTSSMCDVFLKEHGFNSVLIGIYKGDEQLKLDAHLIE